MSVRKHLRYRLQREAHLQGAAVGSGANSRPGRANFSVLRGFSSPKHRIPDCRRDSALNAQTSDCELAFANAMHHFDAGNRERRIPELLEPKHWPDAA